MTDTGSARALPIHIHSVTKTYGSIFALDNVDLDVRSGEFLIQPPAPPNHRLNLISSPVSETETLSPGLNLPANISCAS